MEIVLVSFSIPADRLMCHLKPRGTSLSKLGLRESYRKDKRKDTLTGRCGPSPVFLPRSHFAVSWKCLSRVTMASLNFGDQNSAKLENSNT